MGQYIDFKFVKQHADVETVLAALQIDIVKRSGNELRIHCPNPDHDDKNASCDVNTAEEGTFYCHSCGATGSIIDLVALYNGTDIRAATIAIGEYCNIPLSKRSPPRSRSGKGQTTKEKPKQQTNARHPNASAGKSETNKPFEPYTGILKLDVDHHFGQDRGLDAETIERFGMGFQSRGMFKDRWCLPIHDQAGNQLGYMGRSVKKRLPQGESKWLFPPNFPKQTVLFNLHRALAIAEGYLIVVEGGLDAVRLDRLGYPAVALLGHSISEQHIALLSSCDIDHVLVMLDGDEAGQAATPDVVMRLAESFYVRAIELPQDEDPESVAEAFLDEQIWWLA